MFYPLSPLQLKKAYNDCCGRHGDLKTHLQETGANSRKINTTMERYGYITCTLTLQADQLLRCKETAATDLKLVRDTDYVTMTSPVIPNGFAFLRK